jgi:hypothetical protein
MRALHICTRPRHGPVQMCIHLYQVVSSPGTNVMASHLYWAEAPTGTNVRLLDRLGCVSPRRGSVRGHLYRLMAPTGTNVLICTGGKIPSTNEKSGLGYMCDSLAVQ